MVTESREREVLRMVAYYLLSWTWYGSRPLIDMVTWMYSIEFIFVTLLDHIHINMSYHSRSA